MWQTLISFFYLRGSLTSFFVHLKIKHHQTMLKENIVMSKSVQNMLKFESKRPEIKNFSKKFRLDFCYFESES